MKDIDFDELDRAVNSVIGTASSDMVAEPAPESTNSDETIPVAVSVTSSTSQVDDSQNQPAAPAPLAARRSSGRFMDVVHPSSDMRSTTSESSTPSLPQFGKTVTPSAEFEETPQDTTTEASPEAWPDPIDMAQQDTSPEVSSPETPLESPFLADAKVEKRPLGAFSSDTPEPTEAVDQKTNEESEIEEHPIHTDVPMPAELQDDLLSIESDSDVPAIEETPDAPAPLVTPPVAVETTGPTSINQQYSEQPSTSEQPAPVIFNTDAYKQPLAHPGKKKSGWLVVLWVFLLLVVGAGIGALVYYQVLPLL